MKDLNRVQPVYFAITFALILTGTLLGWALGAAAQTSDEGRLAQLTQVINEVEVLREDAGDWVAVEAPHPLFMGDRVRTGPDSRAEVVFDDGSRVHMTERTTLEVTPRFEADEESPGIAARVRVFFGKIFNRINPQESSLEFESPDALAAVRGTDFSITVTASDGIDPELPDSVDFETWRGMHDFRTRLVVADGIVRFSNPFAFVDVGAEQASESTSTTPPTAPQPAGEDELEEVRNEFSDDDADVADGDGGPDRGLLLGVAPSPAGAAPDDDPDDDPDSVAIVTLSVQPETFHPLHPNRGTVSFGARLSEASSWQVRIVEGSSPSGSPVRAFAGGGDDLEIEWDGRESETAASPVADGTYTFVLEVLDEEGGVVDTGSASVIVDTQPPFVISEYPRPGDELDEDDETIWVSWGDEGSGLAPETVQAYVHGVPVPATVNDGIVSIDVTPDLRQPGTTIDVTVYVEDRAGNDEEYAWTFTVAAPPSGSPVTVTSVTASPEAFSPDVAPNVVELRATLSAEADWRWTIVRSGEKPSDPDLYPDLWVVQTDEGQGSQISVDWDGDYSPADVVLWDPSDFDPDYSPSPGDPPPTDADGKYFFIVEVLAEDGTTLGGDGVDFILDATPPRVWEPLSIQDGDLVAAGSTLEVMFYDELSRVDLGSVQASVFYQSTEMNPTVTPSIVQSSDLPHHEGILLEVSTSSTWEPGGYDLEVTFQDAAGNTSKYEIEFQLTGDPFVTDTQQRWLVLPEVETASLDVWGGNLDGAALVLHVAGLPPPSAPSGVIVPANVTDGGTKATLTLDTIGPGIYRVWAQDPNVPLDWPPASAPTLLVTTTGATGANPALTQVRNDLSRSGAGRGPQSDGDWNSETVTGIRVDDFAMGGGYAIIKDAYGYQLSFVDLSTGNVAATVSVSDWSDWKPALATLDSHTLAFYSDHGHARWNSVPPGAVSGGLSYDFANVDDMLVHDGLLLLSARDSSEDPWLYAIDVGFEARIAALDMSTTISQNSGSVYLALFEGLGEGSSVLLAYGDYGIKAFDLHSFQELWDYSWSDDGFNSPQVAVDRASERVFALVQGVAGPTMYVLDASTGTHVAADLSGNLTDPWFAADALAVADGRAWVLLTDGDDEPVLKTVSSGGQVEDVVSVSEDEAVYPASLVLSPDRREVFFAVNGDGGDSYLYTVDMDTRDVVDQVVLRSVVAPQSSVNLWVSTLIAADDALWVGNENLGLFRLTRGTLAATAFVDPPLEKTANRAHAQIGDVITYTVTFDNSTRLEGQPELSPQDNVWIQDVLPPGFVYVEGSSYVYPAGVNGGVPPMQVPDPTGSRTLYWELATAADLIPVGGMRSLTYQVMVGPRAMEGAVHTNTAMGFLDGDADGVFANACAHGVTDPVAAGCDFVLTNVARADVLVTTSVFTPRTHIVGKVFHDINGDGRQNPGEPGVAGVRIITERGVIVTTDKAGMYHLANLPPGRFVLRLDESTLPEGMRVAGRGPTLLLDTYLGGLYTVNFVVEGE